MAHEGEKRWYVFHRFATHFAYGTRESAERYLRFLNRNRAPDSFMMHESDHRPVVSEFPDDNWAPNFVNMEADMAEWEG